MALPDARSIKTGMLPSTRSLPFRLLFASIVAAASTGALTAQIPESGEARSVEIRALREQLDRISTRLDRLEAEERTADTGAEATGVSSSAAVLRRASEELRSPIREQVRPPLQETAAAPADAGGARSDAGQPLTAADRSALTFLEGTTFNVLLDAYYGFNFNRPIGRANLLRAYDVSSNAVSLNQADFIIEHAANPEAGKRFGVRLDLQYGQATATLQGNPVNEARPDIYRNIFQAYGTYIVPVGSGISIDVGKWASSLGLEGNYTKDQINYSRSYWFTYLPFYHAGARASYQVNPWLAAHYWVVNGTNQTEPTNGFKDELIGLESKPHKGVDWTVNYYVGQEHPNFMYVPGGAAGLPTQQGSPFEPIPNPARGKLHIFDSYATWNATSKLTVAGEADYVIERDQTHSAPSHTDGGSLYAKYQLTPALDIAGRTEYLSDRGGLFSGKTQALKEFTVGANRSFGEGFQMRGEVRRDFSNQPYFLTGTLYALNKDQVTATVGLVWWFGGKQGAW